MGDFDATTDSLRSVANTMENGAIATAKQLRDLLKDLAGSTSPSDWSSVPSCRAFGTTYIAAIEAYQQAAADMLSDAQDMQATLRAVAKDYDDADGRRRDDFNARMAALGGENYMTEKQDGKQGYDANEGDLQSDDPKQAPDQQPAGGGDTSTSSSSSSGTGAGRAGPA